MKLSLSEPINKEDVLDWINADKQQESTDAMIINIKNESNDDDEISDDEIWHMKILPYKWTKSYRKCY